MCGSVSERFETGAGDWDGTLPPAGTLERPLRGRLALDCASSLSSGVPSEPCPLSRSNAQREAGLRPQVGKMQAQGFHHGTH